MDKRLWYMPTMQYCSANAIQRGWISKWAEWKKPGRKTSRPLWSHLYTILGNANESIMTASRSVVSSGWGETGVGWGRVWIPEGPEDTLGEMDIFAILSLAVVSQVYTFVKTYPIVSFRYLQFFFFNVNYTSIKLLKSEIQVWRGRGWGVIGGPELVNSGSL